MSLASGDPGFVPASQSRQHMHPRPSRLFLACKRLFDIAFVLIVMMPILLVGMLILLVMNPRYNPGPMFYSQKRIGRNGRVFTIYKFRTMLGDGDGARFACAETDRISPFGHWLRRWRFDGLPQIINVLIGDMSLIGPRPEQVDFARQYEQAIPFYSDRHSVRPGISGLAQIKQGYTSCEKSTSSKLQWDMHYIRRMGFGMESYIFRKTLGVVKSKFGAK